MLRIVGGTWRGRRLRFPPSPGIRPTPDRVRETLFNWLAPHVLDARCLDLFAGSGALGLEALSRGAAHVTFVEQDVRAARAIEACLLLWDPAHHDDWQLAGVDARFFLAGSAQPFDIVFLDPPFGSGLLEAACGQLERSGWLAPHARIYLECPAGAEPVVPVGWTRAKTKKAGQVGYHLFQRGNHAE